MGHKKAIVTGVTGQDGSYLAELLLSKNYEVHAIVRKSSSFNEGRIHHLYKDIHRPEVRLFLHYGDLTDSNCITKLLYEVQPEEIYHLGAQSHVRVSFDMPTATGDITGLATTRILEALHRSDVKAKFYQASSSEMFGAAPPPQSEQTPFYPRSPYAAAKVYAYWMTVNYREAYGHFACNGILFNHESPRRGDAFVTRKISKVLAKMIVGELKHLHLGNLEAKRDWGFAPEYVEAMHMMLQRDEPDDFVIGTGESHSVREFIERAFTYAGIELEWKGEGKDEIGIAKSVDPKVGDHISAGDTLIKIDPWYYRPTEVQSLCADTSKSRKVLGWEPRVTFDRLVELMVDYDLALVGKSNGEHAHNVLVENNLTWTQNVFYEVS